MAFTTEHDWEALIEQISERLVAVEGFAELPLDIQERIEGEVARIVDYFMEGAFKEGRDDERYSLKMQISNRITDWLFKED